MNTNSNTSSGQNPSRDDNDRDSEIQTSAANGDDVSDVEQASKWARERKDAAIYVLRSHSPLGRNRSPNSPVYTFWHGLQRFGGWLVGSVAVIGVLGALSAPVTHPDQHLLHAAIAVIVVGGVLAVLGTVGAQFTRYVPVLEPHEAMIHASAGAIASCIKQDVTCRYGDDADSEPRQRQAFRTHFKRGAVKLDRWDALVDVHEQAKQALKERIEAEASRRGITAANHDVGVIVAHIQGSTVDLAHKNRLEADSRLEWGGSPDAGGHIAPKGDRINQEWITLPREGDESNEAWKVRADALTGVVERLGRDSQDWPQAVVIKDAWDAMRTFKPPILRGLQAIQEQAAPSFKRRCGMCKGSSL
jgi:hypothetical protein